MHFLEQFVFFDAAASLAAFGMGLLLQRRWRTALLNPLLIAIAAIMGMLSVTGISYASYYEGAHYIGYLLTPATVCLAIPLYETMGELKKHWKAILSGVAAGILSTMGIVWAMSVLFGLSYETFVTLLPKSITAAIGMDVAKELGGYVTITAASIIITGILGNMFAPAVCRLAGIREPVAKGIAIGSSSHAIGTAKAVEMGEVEGAMSGLSVAVSGVFTALVAAFFARIY